MRYLSDSADCSDNARNGNFSALYSFDKNLAWDFIIVIFIVVRELRGEEVCLIAGPFNKVWTFSHYEFLVVIFTWDWNIEHAQSCCRNSKLQRLHRKAFTVISSESFIRAHLKTQKTWKVMLKASFHLRNYSGAEITSFYRRSSICN